VEPKIYHASDHDIDQALIDTDAIQIIQRLKNAGFLAYLVGGSVRDLLVKKKPKDFDISTSALPEEIKQIFQRSCILIGRRFRLAHIYFGHKVFEVSTFRTGENDSDIIVHDNMWGTPEEDVLRRDFTINGLFYDPPSHTVIDYVGGWNDIHKNTLRTIGDPVTRFKQDPVRMIRLLKFQARFNFNVDEKSQKALERCHEEILKSSPARLLEEMLRMLESGTSEPFFRLMVDYKLLEHLFPCLNFFLQGKFAEDVYTYLKSADKLNAFTPTKPLDRSLLTACLIYPMLEKEINDQYLKYGKVPSFAEILLLTGSLIKGVLTSSFSQFPKRITMTISFILTAQYRLTPIAKNKKHQKPKLIFNKEYELALQFLMIRSHVNESLIDEYNWWCHLFREIARQSSPNGHHHVAPSQIAFTSERRKKSNKEEEVRHHKLLTHLQKEMENGE